MAEFVTASIVEPDQKVPHAEPEQEVVDPNTPSQSMPLHGTVGDMDDTFATVWGALDDQDVALHVLQAQVSDKVPVEPRLQTGHTKRLLRKPTKKDEICEDTSRTSRKQTLETERVVKRKKTSAPKVDHWSDCTDCGKWRILQRPAVTNRRFVCAIVGVDCSDECDCEEDCDCDN